MHGPPTLHGGLRFKENVSIGRNGDFEVVNGVSGRLQRMTHHLTQAMKVMKDGLHHPIWLSLLLLVGCSSAEAPQSAEAPDSVGVSNHSPLATILDSSPSPDSTTGRFRSDLAERYRVELVTSPTFNSVSTSHGPITLTAAPDDRVESYVRLIAPEWNLYPPSLVSQCGLRRIILCRNLAYAGQSRAAVPDFEHDDLYLDVARGRHDLLYVRGVMHHEFYHIIDWHDDGKLYEDDEWCELLRPGVSYGNGGASMQNPRPEESPGMLDASLDGFLNRYSMSGVEEDKAEMFANLIVRQDDVSARASSDTLIGEKMRRLMRTIREFCPEMDDAFWDRARSLDRTGR